MAQYGCTVSWCRGDAVFTDQRYPRAHRWRFDGGLEVAASSSPHVVPVPLSDPSAVDPEEAFVAALSSCHLLWFLSIVARAGYVVDAYDDEPTGRMGRDADGKVAMLEVTLRPAVRFGGEQPDRARLEGWHRDAHAQCFIANSVRTEVRCVPRDVEAAA